MVDLNKILEIPESGVIIVLSGSAAWVGYSTDVLMALARLGSELRTRTTNPEIKVVSVTTDIETLQLHTAYYRQYYHVELGLAELLPYGKSLVKYRVRKVPSNRNERIDVELVTARGSSIGIVGRFKTDREAQDFIETYYKSGQVYPVYANNTDTKVLMLEQQTELLEVR